jgi:hypothetical protein
MRQSFYREITCNKGGLAFSSYLASATLIVLIVAFILVFTHTPAKRTH